MYVRVCLCACVCVRARLNSQRSLSLVIWWEHMFVMAICCVFESIKIASKTHLNIWHELILGSFFSLSLSLSVSVFIALCRTLIALLTNRIEYTMSFILSIRFSDSIFRFHIFCTDFYLNFSFNEKNDWFWPVCT